MAKIKENEYYKGFVEGVEYSCKAAEMLKAVFSDFRPHELEKHINDIHEIEHAGDTLKHTLMKKLVKEFITPIEREDIMSLFEKIDDVTDSIDDVLMRLYMNNITKIRDDVIPFTEIIIKCCNTLKKVMHEFPSFKKSENLVEYIISLNTLEEEGDRMYMKAMRRLHTQSNDLYEIMKWREIYECLEKCCDACEHTADVVESVVMKNT